LLLELDVPPTYYIDDVLNVYAMGPTLHLNHVRLPAMVRRASQGPVLEIVRPTHVRVAGHVYAMLQRQREQTGSAVVH
jgi:hypothetical protein